MDQRTMDMGQRDELPLAPFTRRNVDCGVLQCYAAFRFEDFSKRLCYTVKMKCTNPFMAMKTGSSGQDPIGS